MTDNPNKLHNALTLLEEAVLDPMVDQISLINKLRLLQSMSQVTLVGIRERGHENPKTVEHPVYGNNTIVGGKL